MDFQEAFDAGFEAVKKYVDDALDAAYKRVAALEQADADRRAATQTAEETVQRAVAALPVPKDGERGEKGDIGPIGRDGRDGINGKDGRDGIDGQKGADGLNGKDGIHGKDGVDGLPGKDGRDGDAGPRGERGEPGEKGETGERGRDGVDGAKGEPGERGEPGRDGKDGVNGLDGKDGAPGRDGAAGEKGLQGERGEKGEKGDPGLNGKDGLDIVDVIRAGDRFLVVMSNGTTKDLGDCRGKDGRDGLNGKDAEIFAPDNVVDNLIIATKMLAMRPDSIDMHGAKGISLQFPSIEIPAPQVHVSPTIVNMPQKRMRTVVKKHDAEGRIQEIEQQEID